MVNVDVTGPGATLGLGLMFCRTNSESVARRLALPQTHFDLDLVRPDFMLLRVLARALIMWDSVQPCQAWVDSNLPQIIQSHIIPFPPIPLTSEGSENQPEEPPEENGGDLEDMEIDSDPASEGEGGGSESLESREQEDPVASLETPVIEQEEVKEKEKEKEREEKTKSNLEDSDDDSEEEEEKEGQEADFEAIRQVHEHTLITPITLITQNNPPSPPLL